MPCAQAEGALYSDIPADKPDYKVPEFPEVSESLTKEQIYHLKGTTIDDLLTQGLTEMLSQGFTYVLTLVGLGTNVISDDL